MSKHKLGIVEIGVSDLGGITRKQIAVGNEIISEGSSGIVYHNYQGVRAIRPGFSFSTKQVGNALTILGAVGSAIDDLTNVVLWALLRDGAGNASGNVHSKYTATEGWIAPTTLSCDHRGDAILEVAGQLIASDGTTAPWTISRTNAAPTDGSTDQRFTLGGCTIESIAVGQLTQLSINFGLQVVTEGQDSTIYDTEAYVARVAPSISGTLTDVELLAAAEIPLTGKAATHTNTSIYLRKRAAGSTYVADGTAEHLKFTAAGLCYIENALDDSHDDDGPATINFMMPLKWDGTNLPLVITVGSAIT